MTYRDDCAFLKSLLNKKKAWSKVTCEISKGHFIRCNLSNTKKEKMRQASLIEKERFKSGMSSLIPHVQIDWFRKDLDLSGGSNGQRSSTWSPRFKPPRRGSESNSNPRNWREFSANRMTFIHNFFWTCVGEKLLEKMLVHCKRAWITSFAKASLSLLGEGKRLKQELCRHR